MFTTTVFRVYAVHYFLLLTLSNKGYNLLCIIREASNMSDFSDAVGMKSCTW